jgi:hypothetical protein
MATSRGTAHLSGRGGSGGGTLLGTSDGARLNLKRPRKLLRPPAIIRGAMYGTALQETWPS